MLNAGLGKDKRKFTDLTEGEPHQDRSAQLQAQQHGRTPGNEYLEEDNRRGNQDDQPEMPEEKTDIQQHADGNEKEAHKDIPEGEYIAERLMAVFGFGNNQSSQKRPESE